VGVHSWDPNAHNLDALAHLGSTEKPISSLVKKLGIFLVVTNRCWYLHLRLEKFST
jgi:hypothetical protein